MESLTEYQVFTHDKMYSVFATHFTADKNGVMFFNGGEGIAFVPNCSLNLVRFVGKHDIKKIFETPKTEYFVDATKK